MATHESLFCALDMHLHNHLSVNFEPFPKRKLRAANPRCPFPLALFVNQEILFNQLTLSAGESKDFSDRIGQQEPKTSDITAKRAQ